MKSRLLLFLVALSACSSDPESAGRVAGDPDSFTTVSDWSPDGAAVVFMSNRDGNADIFRIEPGDTAWVNLTRNEAGENWPEVSADGSRIVFQALDGGRYDIWIMGADGSNPSRLTTDDDHDYLPSWMPDGRVLFSSWRQEAEDSVRAQHVYTMNADGSDQRRLALAGGVPVTGARVAPDGKTLVYGREVGEDLADLWLASFDDLTGIKVTRSDAYYGDPSFSPDGRRLAYYADRGSRSDLLVRDLATAAVDTALTGGKHWYPRFSPDGRWMLSCSETEHGNLDILYFPLDRSAAPRPLVAGPTRECEGRWTVALGPPAAP